VFASVDWPLNFAYYARGDSKTPAIVGILAVGDNLAQLVLDRDFTGFKGGSHSGRVNGWTMQALAPAYQIAPRRRYLRALRTLADDALEEQDPHCGGWLYELPFGHCFCEKRKHVGEAGFIGSVRMNGLCLYYQLTGDRRIPDALKRYVDFLIRDTWNEKEADWRYTSCPATSLVHQPGVTIRALVYSACITGDPEHIRILRRAWGAKFRRLQAQADAPERTARGQGKVYAHTMYGSTEAASLFARTEEQSPP